MNALVHTAPHGRLSALPHTPESNLIIIIIIIVIIILAFVVFNPGDLYYLGY